MSTIEKTIGASREKKLDIRLGRVLLAAVLAEAAVILVLLAITQTYSLFIAPGLTNAEYSEFGQLAGYYVAPAAGALSTFAMVLWLARALKSNFVANGILTGVAGVLLTVGFLATAKPEHRLMYLISFVLRIVAGYLGGLISQKRAEFGKRDAH
jgi:hypothetical protein